MPFSRGPLRPQQFFKPTVDTVAPQLVTPAAASLVLTTFAPTVSTPGLVTPASASLILTTFAPTVTVSGGSKAKGGGGVVFPIYPQPVIRRRPLPVTPPVPVQIPEPIPEPVVVPEPVLVAPMAAVLRLETFRPQVLVTRRITRADFRDLMLAGAISKGEWAALVLAEAG